MKNRLCLQNLSLGLVWAGLVWAGLGCLPKQQGAKQETLRNVQGLQVGQSVKLLAMLRNAHGGEAKQFVQK